MYNISDPDSIYEMRMHFDSIREEEWDNFIELAKENKLGYTNIKALMDGQRYCGRSHAISGDKRVLWIMNLVNQLDDIIENDKKNNETIDLIKKKHFNIRPSNVTLRVAWHDNKWNGHICKDPKGNTYCNGLNSLLSERIRKRKEKGIDQEILHKGKSLNEIDYLPPCFWSINLFGEKEINVKHDNPAAPKLKDIEDKIPPNSMLSWPFALSFTRTLKERQQSGAYPKNLETVRIPRFNAKLEEGQSIAFMYAKFSNPLTEEEQQYLVVGAGIINEKEKTEEMKHFGPIEEIEKIRSGNQGNKKYRNFPSINWAMRLSFQEHSTIRMPYHEYLDEADNLNDDAKDEFFSKIKVAITEPELEWCFKYVAMDIGDDEAIYILTKMRKALIDCKYDDVVPVNQMEEKIEKVEELLKMAWESRSYFPGFTSISRALLNQLDEPSFPLQDFYEEFKIDSKEPDKELLAILLEPKSDPTSKNYIGQIRELKNRLEQRGISIKEFLSLSLLNLKPFQFERILKGKLKIEEDWIRDFNNDIKRSHETTDIINNPYLLYEDYDYWPDSHDDVYGDELDAPIDLFKIDIAYFPDSRYIERIDLQDTMSFIDKRRIRALILRTLYTFENTGDCFVSAKSLQELIQKYPLYFDSGQEYSIPSNFFYPLNAEYANHFENYENKLVLVKENDTMYYYLSQVYNAEKSIESNLNTLLSAHDNNESYPDLAKYLNESINKLKRIIGKDFDEEGFRKERTQLYTNIFTKKLFVISGSAGSGKSYEILNIISHLEKVESQEYLILAPTGKAALRLSSDQDFPGITASTIDKLITDVKYNKISPLQLKQFKNVIIDEASMVDLLKFEKLLNIFNFKEPSFKRLIVIGDPNQLPAIGYGRVLADLISYLNMNTPYHNNLIQLETNCRSELSKNKVITLANAFKQKGELDLNLQKDIFNKKEQISEGFRVKYWTNENELYKQVKDEFIHLTDHLKLGGPLHHRLNKVIGLTEEGELIDGGAKVENFQILSPYKAQYSGSSKLNDFFQIEFKKEMPFKLQRNKFKKSDKLIRTKNYYNKKKLVLSNGTLGFIMNPKNEKFKFETIGKYKEIGFNEIRASEQEFFELAYAITIHKSQGSGFNHLFLILPARYGLLSKELVYTALTRTKKSITLFLQTPSDDKKNVLEIALGRSFSASRRTSLLLDKPYRHYNLEPELGVYVESRVELLIYHMLMSKRNQLTKDVFNFTYETRPIIDGKELIIKTDFTIYCNGKEWYWEHLGLLGQQKYTWTWQNVKKKTYQEAGIFDFLITTDESNGINPTKISEIIDLIVTDKVTTEEEFNRYSKHHYYLR